MNSDATTTNNQESGVAVPVDEIQAELEAFLNATAAAKTTTTSNRNHRNKRKYDDNQDDDNDDNYDDDDEYDDHESFESDNGTRYIKDIRTGNWIHEALHLYHQQQQQETGKNPKSISKVTGIRSNNTSMKWSKPQEHEQQVYREQSNHTTITVTTKTNTSTNDASNPTTKESTKKKTNKSKFSNRNSRCWIYVTGLPTDTNEQEVASIFKKAGILDIDPVTQLPKIKLYRHRDSSSNNGAGSKVGQLKGDASICYARPESVSLAIMLLDDTYFRIPTTSSSSSLQEPERMKVQAAKFEPKSEPQSENGTSTTTTTLKRQAISNVQRKVAKLATKQAMDWDDSGIYTNGRLTGGRKGLCIIVLKYSFDPQYIQTLSDDEQDSFLYQLEQELRIECEQFGEVEKITFFTGHPEGITIVKFIHPTAASDAIQYYDINRHQNTKTIVATFWDGVTDYTVKDETKEAIETAKREEEFGDWLEKQQLPDDLQLQTE